MLIEKYNDSIAINVGSGTEISIMNLASMIAKIIGYPGKLTFNSDYPNGTARKLLDSGRISHLGWTPEISLEEGIAATYDWFLRQGLKEIAE
jgi:GDP-L-fucose synthase